MKRSGDIREEIGLPLAAGRAGAPDDGGTLHVRCGSDIHDALRLAGCTGRFLEFSDPYCQGPVRHLPRETFVAERAAFIADAYRLDRDATHDRLSSQYRDLDDAASFDRVVLWFEHDTYDQLILAAALNALQNAQCVELICVDAVPGVARFIGLGQLSPSQLLGLWRRERRRVTDGDFRQGVDTWNALRRDDPSALHSLARTDNPPMPIMARALHRHLQELPGAVDGLGLTQRLVLEILAARGKITAGSAFRVLMHEYEPLPYLGDLMFGHVLDDLQATAEPVIRIEDHSRGQSWARKKLSITDAGRCILRAEADFLDLYDGSRWIGGVEARRGAGVARWDREGDCLIPG